jgi:hypothetical protein
LPFKGWVRDVREDMVTRQYSHLRSGAHLSILKQGMKSWHVWRAAHPNVRPELGAGDLAHADLNGANLKHVNLAYSNLVHAKLGRANLEGTDLRGANLRGANLNRAKLGGADLSRADLRYTNLCDADLRTATLLDSRLSKANLTGVKLWETQRTGGSVKDIVCRHAFWDRNGRELTEYEEGEFERVFADKPRIVLTYPGGMSPIEIAMLPLMVQRLQAEHSGCALHISSLHDDRDGALVNITVDNLSDRNSVSFEADVEALRSTITTLQQQLQHQGNVHLVLQAEFRGYQSAADTLMDRLFDQATLPRQTIHVDHPTAPIVIEGSPMTGDTYNISGQAGAVGPHAHAHDNTIQKVQGNGNLASLAKEFDQLRAAMKQEPEGPPEQDVAIGAVAAAQNAAKQGDGLAIPHCLKSAGSWALAIAEKIGVPLAVEALKKAL